jgi:hypothetical protein
VKADFQRVPENRSAGTHGAPPEAAGSPAPSKELRVNKTLDRGRNRSPETVLDGVFSEDFGDCFDLYGPSDMWDDLDVEEAPRAHAEAPHPA